MRTRLNSGVVGALVPVGSSIVVTMERVNYGIIGQAINSVTSGGVYTEEDLRLAELAGTWPNVASTATPTIVSLVYANSSRAANTAGSETITVNGFNFLNTSTITVNGVSVTTTYVSGNQLTFVTRTMPGEGQYNLVVTNPSTSLSSTTTIFFSAPPIFYTPAGSLGSFTPGAPVSIPINIYSSPVETVTVSIISGSLPSGLAFDTFYNTITGTAPIITATTSYSITMQVTNSNNQTTTRAFSISIIGTQVDPIATGGTITTSGNYKIHKFTSSGTFSVTFNNNATMDILVVAGGGGGGYYGGGGGAGGLIYNTGVTIPANSYTINVGSGGAGAPITNNATGSNGSNSYISGSGFTTLTAIGGGGGGSNMTSYEKAKDGGSGGGGGSQLNGTANLAGAALQPSSSSGGYGNSGGYSPVNNSGKAGGGGGAGGAGTVTVAQGSAGVGGSGGGAGLSNSITGTAVTYAAGGQGFDTSPNGQSPTTNNTGNGGNGSVNVSGNPGAGGDSGIVIIRYLANSFTSGATVWINPLNNTSYTYYQNFAITNIQLNAYTFYGDTQTYSASGLPTGMSCSSSGVVSGTPTVSGTVTTTFTVTSSYNSVASSITVTFNILAEFNAWVSPTSGSTVSGGSTFVQGFAITPITLTASGALPGDNTFTYSSSNLPAGLSISGNQIVGTPTTYGSFSVTVTATSAFTSATTSVSFSISILSPYTVATGGTITTSGNYKIHSFTTSSTFTVTQIGGSYANVEIFVLGGGGGGGGGGPTGYQRLPGGGGSGGAIYHSNYNGLTAKTYTVTIGGGGSGGTGATSATNGNTGSLSSIDIFNGDGGGGGAKNNGNVASYGTSLASQGGTSGWGPSSGQHLGVQAFTSSQLSYAVSGATNYPGYAGGPNYGLTAPATNWVGLSDSGTGGGGGGGGGGLGSAGLPGPYRSNNSPSAGGGDGGQGISDPILGNHVGGGGASGGGGYAHAYAGGGSSVTSEFSNGINGLANYGGGGGGGGNQTGLPGGSGGSGIVLIRYRYQ